MPKITNDAGHLETEAEIKKLEKEIRKEYQKAAKEVEDKLNKYMSSFSAKDEIKRKQVADKILTQEEYEKWRIGQIAVGKRWEEMKTSLASDLANTSEIARSTARGYMPQVYALNHNYATFQVEQSSLLDTSYTLYDRQTVERLFREKPKLMPPMSAKTAEKIRQGKLVKWNEQKIQSSVVQGILQGESIPKIARRMRDVTDMNYKASIRNARTSITSAQNGGRMDAYHRAEDMGIHQKKQWLATLDDRTRHEHVDLDGQRQELDDPFEIDGYEIMFPGDPSADPAMVYNCRCTMVTVFDGYDKQVSDFDLTQNEKLGNMSYEEWKKEHGTKQKEEEPDFKVVQGKDISDTWVRRPDKFDFEIDDVIDAQGFDGVPRVVSADEFDKAVKESNFIAQRTYSAPDQETLDAYQQQLYGGKWYVDCSMNGADRGQGMYCAANYSTNTHGLSEEMKYYIDYNRDTHGYSFSRVETFTLDSSANIADYHTELDNFHNQRKAYRDSNLSKYIDEKILEISPESSQKQLKDLAKSVMGLSDDNISEWEVMHSNPALDTREFAQSWGEFMSDIRSKDYANEFEKGFKEISEFGTYCAAKGYDAIKAPGERGVDSYTVILNRTKCIFRKGG